MIDKIIEVLKKHPTGLKAKDITRYISGTDRKSVNQILYSNSQIFVINNSYEWTLKDEKAVTIPAPLPHSKEVIKEYFPTTYICDECYDVLKSKSHSDLRMCQVRFAELSQEIPCTLYISQLVKTVLFVSNEEFSTIIKRTKRLKEIHKIRSHDEWETIILSPKFDEICLRIIELSKCELLKRLSTDFLYGKDWMKVVTKTPNDFKEFLRRVELLSNINEPIYESELISISLNGKFKSWETRIKKIIDLQKNKRFPILTWCFLKCRFEDFLKLNETRFEMCMEHTAKLYANEGKLFSDIRWIFYDSYIPDFLLFEEDKFDLFCENIQKYTYSSLTESFNHDEKVNFFLTSAPLFEQANKNIRTLEDASSNGKILPQSKDERIRCMWLSEKEFADVMETKFKEKNEHDRVGQSISETISYYKNNPLRQCTGDCATCRRQECPLDSK